MPRPIRQELNLRLDEGEPGKKTVAWLNSLLEVQAVMAKEFNAKPIREQNLSEWKQGGYRDWTARHETLEIAERLGEDAAEWAGEGRPPLTDTLAHFLVARYAVATRRVAETGGREGRRLLREMCSDIVELRKGDHSAVRLKIEHERLQLERERSEKQIREKVAEFAKQQKNGNRLNPEETNQKLREFFGLPSEAKRKGGISPETLAEVERALRLL